MPNTALRGVYAAVATPFTKEYEPDIGRWLAHCHWLLENGCNGLAPLGTTSEANSISLEKRLEMIAAFGESKLPKGTAIFGTGACAIAEAVRLTRASIDAGAGGQLMLPPFYYKNPSEDGLFAFFSEVIQRVGDDRMRLYLYHFPQMSATPIPVSLTLRLKKEYGDLVAGMKDSSGVWAYTAETLQEIPGFGAFCGNETFLLDTLRAGGAGTISASTNISSAICQKVYANWESDAAADYQAAVTAVRKVFQNFPTFAGQKAVKAHVTGDPEWERLSPPLEPMSAAAKADLIGQLQALGHLSGYLKAA
ncbi:MAG: dihydrodipicolinate synthase family protein [Rhodospirillales bacterium]